MRLENIKLQTTINGISNIPVIKVAGEIDIYTATKFKSELNGSVDSGARDLIVDLSDVNYIDSGGFGALLGAVKRVKPEGGTVNLVGCSETIRRMLRITNLDAVFGIYENVEDAGTAMGRMGDRATGRI